MRSGADKIHGLDSANSAKRFFAYPLTEESAIMFALKVAKAQMKAVDNPTSKMTPYRSTSAGHRLGRDPVELSLFLQRTIGNQATLRLLGRQTSRPAVSNPPSDCEQGAGATENTMTEETSRGVSWDFSKIPLFPPERASRGSSPQPSIIQRKLVVGQPNDPLEHEADRVADQVIRMPDPAPLQFSRKYVACGEQDALHPKEAAPHAAGGEVPALVHDVLRAPGKPLDPITRAFFEPRFGRDLGNVRVSADTAAARSAAAVGARAYTVGRRIAFAAGEYAPGTSSGLGLLAHELAHVVQQGGGGPAPPQSCSARPTSMTASPSMNCASWSAKATRAPPRRSTRDTKA
jgi:hypothetical protein